MPQWFASSKYAYNYNIIFSMSITFSCVTCGYLFPQNNLSFIGIKNEYLICLFNYKGTPKELSQNRPIKPYSLDLQFPRLFTRGKTLNNCVSGCFIRKPVYGHMIQSLIFLNINPFHSLFFSFQRQNAYF